jgi:hypothetical protein
VQIENNTSKSLLAEIEAAFPFEEMPSAKDLITHKDGWAQCNDLLADYEEIRKNPITGNTIRYFHQELRCLSEKGLKWIFPYYLRYCISSEGQYSRMETEFLVYNFSPSANYKEETLRRFAFLGKDKIECIRHFIDWCSTHPHWMEYFPEHLQMASEFLQILSDHSERDKV